MKNLKENSLKEVLIKYMYCNENRNWNYKIVTNTHLQIKFTKGFREGSSDPHLCGFALVVESEPLCAFNAAGL